MRRLAILLCLSLSLIAPARAERPTAEPPLPAWTSAADVAREDGTCTLESGRTITFTSYGKQGFMGSVLFAITAEVDKTKVFQFDGSASGEQLGTAALAIKTKTGSWRAYVFGVPGDIEKAQREFLAALGTSADEFIACLDRT